MTFLIFYSLPMAFVFHSVVEPQSISRLVWVGKRFSNFIERCRLWVFLRD